MAAPLYDRPDLTNLPRLLACRARWLARRDELRRLHALVDGAELCDALLDELDEIVSESADEPLSLQEASEESGYSADHLAREVRAGRIPNAGRRGSPRIRRGDLKSRVTLPAVVT